MRYDKSKKMIKKLLKQEIKNNNNNMEVFPISKIDFLYQRFNKNIYFIDRSLKDYLENFGLCNQVIKLGTDEVYNGISIHLDVIKRDSKDKYEYLYNLLTTLYHEYYHNLMYRTKKDNQIDEFKEEVEIYIKNFITNLYNNYHDNFYFEITADLYSINKTKQYLKKYPTIYNKLKNKLEYEKILCLINYINYDLQTFLNYIHKTIINNDFVVSSEFISVLYNQEYELKTIHELYETKKWIQFEEELQNIIISSKCYLDNQNISNLSQEELKIILKAINYSYHKELKRYKENKDLKNKIIKNEENFTKEQNIEVQKIINRKLKYNFNKMTYLKNKIVKLENLIIIPSKIKSKK